MTSETTLFMLFTIACVILAYTIIVLIKRKEYENTRVYSGYNALLFGIFMLTISSVIKAIEFGLLAFREEAIIDYVIYVDTATNLVLLPIVGISFLVAMFIFKEL